MSQLGLLVIHGMGITDDDFDKKFKKRLFRRIKRLHKNVDDIAYQKVWWAEYLDKRQIAYMEESQLVTNHSLNWSWLRHFIMGSLADASAYMRKEGQDNENYKNIINRIYQSVKAIRDELGSDDKPLIIVAHSLGAFIMNNYIWDAHKKLAGETIDWPVNVPLNGPFEHMVNVTGMITFGCNMPMFVIGNDPILPIQFPHPQLNASLATKSKWLNFYDPDDVLGWPLKSMKYSFDGKVKPANVKDYSDVVTEDVLIETHSILGASPASHMSYWDDINFIKSVADYICEFI